MKTKKYTTGGDILGTTLQGILGSTLAPINSITGGGLNPIQQTLNKEIGNITNQDPTLLKSAESINQVQNQMAGIGIEALKMAAGFKDGGSITDMFTQAYSHGGKLDYSSLEAIGVTKRQANKAYRDFVTKYQGGGGVKPKQPQLTELQEDLIKEAGTNAHKATSYVNPKAASKAAAIAKAAPVITALSMADDISQGKYARATADVIPFMNLGLDAATHLYQGKDWDQTETGAGINRSFTELYENVIPNQLWPALQKAPGALYDSYKKAFSHADGGNVNQQNLMPYNPKHLEKESENLVQYDGPDHPQGGIKTPSGEFNLQETVLKAGKVSDTPYAFSDINVLDKSTAEQLGLDAKHVGKTMAEISKSIEKKYEVKFNDDDTKAKTKQLMSQDLYSRLMEANETMLLKAKAKQAWDSKPNYGAMSQDEFNDYMCGGKVDKYQGGSWVDELNAEIDAMPAGTLEMQYRNELLGRAENTITNNSQAFERALNNPNFDISRSTEKSDTRPEFNLGYVSPSDQAEAEDYNEIVGDPYNYFYDKFSKKATDEGINLFDGKNYTHALNVKTNAKSATAAFERKYDLYPTIDTWLREDWSKRHNLTGTTPQVNNQLKNQTVQPVITQQTPRENINVTPVQNRTFNNQIKADPALTQLDFGQATPITSKKGTPQFLNQASINPINDGLNLNIMTDMLPAKSVPQQPKRNDPSLLNVAEPGNSLTPRTIYSPTEQAKQKYDRFVASLGDVTDNTSFGTPIQTQGKSQFELPKQSVGLPETKTSTSTAEAKTNPLTSMTNQEKIGLGLKGLAQLGEIASTLGKKQDVAVQRNPYASQVSQLMRDRYVDMTPIQDQIASSARAAYENLAGTNSQVVNAALGQGISNQSMAQMSQAKLQAQQMNNGYTSDLAQTLNNLGQQDVAAKNYQENLQAQTDANVNNVRREALGNIGNDLGNYFIAKDVAKAKTAEERAFMTQKVKLEMMKIENPSARKESLASMNEVIVRLGGTPIEAKEVGL